MGMIQVDAQWLVIVWIVWMLFSFVTGIRFAKWLYTKHPEKNLSDEEALKKLWAAIKTWLRHWGEP